MTNWKTNTLKVKASSYLVWVRCISARGKHRDMALHCSRMLFHIIAEVTPHHLTLTSRHSTGSPNLLWNP